MPGLSTPPTTLVGILLNDENDCCCEETKLLEDPDAPEMGKIITDDRINDENRMKTNVS